MNTGPTPAHHTVADLEAEDALIDIAIAIKQAQEWNNRRHGQFMRYHLARIEMARREFGK